MRHDMPSARPPADLVRAAEAYLAEEQPDDGPLWQPLTGGRTNRLWQVGQKVVKLYDPAQETPLFPNDPGAEFSAMTTLCDAGLAPRPVARITGEFGVALIYHYLQGATGHGDMAALARMLHRVHSAPPPPGLRRLPGGSREILAQTDALMTLLPKPHAGLAELRKRLNTRDEIAPGPSVLIHADPVSANIVTTDPGPMLIDWQCPALGDPCEDLAIILSPSMQRAYGALLDPAQAAELLSAYPDAESCRRYQRLAPFYHVRMAAYAQWSLENGRATGAEGVEEDLDAARKALTDGA
ncbi:phosphotransferase [Pseudooceanicola sp.]|uniref:phosphotransferase n=2 Tax=Pseudooceanicola sp. TaxID=1914328 RepID=UPI0035C6B94D